MMTMFGGGEKPQGSGQQPGKKQHYVAVFGQKQMYIFVPERDITSWEVGTALQMLGFTGTPGADEIYEGMDPECQRHWKPHRSPQIKKSPQQSGLALPPGMMLPPGAKG